MVIAWLSLLIVLSTARHTTVRDQFEQFKSTFGKTYATTTEEEERFANFQQTLKRIEYKNINSKSAEYAVNKFSDLTKEEFSSLYLMPKVSVEALASSCLAKGITATLNHYDSAVIDALPTSWDWRTTGGKDNKGVVTPVKNQGQCGSCWAFSTTGNIEGLWAMKGNTLTEFSEQLIVDCSHGCSNEPPYGSVCNQGCEGGWQWNAFYDIVNWGGLETETEYPYTAETGLCKMNKADFMAPIKNFTCLSGPNAASEEAMRAYVHQNGPVSIALDASMLQDYYSGIIDPFFPNWECNPNQLDHALLIVGWGQEPDWIDEMTPYWIVKNSWGSDWGDAGYFKIARNYNMCGLANAVSSAIM